MAGVLNSLVAGLKSKDVHGSGVKQQVVAACPAAFLDGLDGGAADCFGDWANGGHHSTQGAKGISSEKPSL